jgi:RNA polymerase sigma factor (sigma-70 family)
MAENRTEKNSTDQNGAAAAVAESPSESSRFQELFCEMREGSSDAAWELLEIYGPHIKAVVRKRLYGRMRAMYDSEDFVQGVWASLFRIQDKLKDIKDPARFVKMLAKNKVIDEIRKRSQSTKHSEGPPRSIDDPESPLANSLVDNSPRPSEWAVAREQWEHLVAGESEQSRRVLELRMAGVTFDEIAEKLGISERTARRVMDRLLEKQWKSHARAAHPWQGKTAR